MALDPVGPPARPQVPVRLQDHQAPAGRLPVEPAAQTLALESMDLTTPFVVQTPATILAAARFAVPMEVRLI